MLDRHEISFGCLTTYLGFILGLGLLALSELLETDDLVRWGIATLCCACTYSLHRSLSTYKERLLEAFTMGREYERARDRTGDLTSIR